jgi:sugar phosphate isomerase/epimerase
MVGYEGGVSLEMEDVSMDSLAGIRKSLDLMREAWPFPERGRRAVREE